MSGPGRRNRKRAPDSRSRGEELRERPSTWLESVHPDDRERARATFFQDDGDRYEVEYRILRPDGELRWIRDRAYPVRDDGETVWIAGLAEDVTERKRFEEELEHQTLQDSLTGLPNRRLLCDRVAHALDRAEQEGSEVAVVVLDVERFSAVNETLGHAAGDELLRVLGSRMRSKVPDDVTVARFGSDEFALLIEDAAEFSEFESNAAEWCEAVTEPCEIAGTEIHPSVSVGVATSGDGGSEARDLLRYASIAASETKSNDGKAFKEYRPESGKLATERLHLENALRRAVDRDEFVVRYQPVVDLETGAPVGVEALARWDHPERGLVSPAEFIPVAEETGLIVPMGYRILEQAASAASRWAPELPGESVDRTFRLSVNLSVRQYRESDLVERVRNIAERTGFPIGQLVLEITESILITEDGKLESLRDEGLRVAVDDFGTGYSSLQYLRRLEADELKIDRSFVNAVQEEGRERILVECVLNLGEALGMDVIAEGVETDRHRRCLLEMGAQLAQGYHFARPMASEEFEAEYLGDDLL